MKSFQEFLSEEEKSSKKLQDILTNQRVMRSAPTAICGDHQMLAPQLEVRYLPMDGASGINMIERIKIKK